MQKIEAFILDRQINMIVMHNIFDIQQDHVHAATISYVAGRYCDSVLMYQSNQYVLPVDFYPRYYVDISKKIDLKKKALACYGDDHDRYNKLFKTTLLKNEVDGFKINMQNKVNTEALNYKVYRKIVWWE